MGRSYYNWLATAEAGHGAGCMISPAYSGGPPPASGCLRAAPEDFAVDEILGFEPGGGGEHAWLWIRKRDATTEDVGAALARFAGVGQRAVGWSGLKDRRAVTAQWFSVHLPGAAEPDWDDFAAPCWRVEQAVRHPRKLRTGTHRANRFQVRITRLTGDGTAVDERARRIAAAGFPNYFGPQRFGRGGANLRRAREQLGRRGRKPRGIILSAARSWLFNRVLEQRIRDSTWCRPVTGDALMLAGTRSMFRCQGDEPDLEARIARFDLNVTGPLWGIGDPPIGPEIARRERDWLADEEALRQAIERTGVAAHRRPLRAVADGMEQHRRDDTLELAFSLPAGVFATSLLRELIASEP